MNSSSCSGLNWARSVSRMLSPSLIFNSFGNKDAATRRYVSGCSTRHSSITSAPCSSKSARKSLRNVSANLVRDPLGRPIGLPDCPGFHFVGVRCAYLSLTGGKIS